jgi:hypothetical protein
MKRSIRFIAVTTVQLLFAEVPYCVLAQPQPLPCPPAERPWYSEKGLVEILRNKNVSAAALSGLIKGCGVRFVMSPSDEAELRGVGASDAVIDAIRASSSAGKAGRDPGSDTNPQAEGKVLATRGASREADKQPLGGAEVPMDELRKQQGVPSEESLAFLNRPQTTRRAYLRAFRT